MKQIKKVLTLSVVLVLLVLIVSSFYFIRTNNINLSNKYGENEIESTDYVNARGVRMTQEQYELLKQYLPENEIKILRQNAFDSMMKDIDSWEFYPDIKNNSKEEK